MGRSQVVNPTRAGVAGGRARNGCDICNICSRERPSPSLPLVVAVLGVLVSWCPGCSDASQSEALEDRHIASNAPLDKCGSALHYRLPGPPYRLLAAAINIKHQSGRSMLSPACLRPGVFRRKVDRDRKPQADLMAHGPWAMSHGPGRPSIIWLAIIVCSSATTHCHPTRTATRRPGGQFTHEPISSPKPVLGAWNPVLRLNRCHPC